MKLERETRLGPAINSSMICWSMAPGVMRTRKREDRLKGKPCTRDFLQLRIDIPWPIDKFTACVVKIAQRIGNLRKCQVMISDIQLVPVMVDCQ